MSEFQIWESFLGSLLRPAYVCLWPPPTFIYAICSAGALLSKALGQPLLVTLPREKRNSDDPLDQR